jgi:hypothetical protein
MLLKISDKIMDEDVDVGQDTQVGQFSCLQTGAALSFSRLLVLDPDLHFRRIHVR